MVHSFHDYHCLTEDYHNQLPMLLPLLLTMKWVNQSMTMTNWLNPRQVSDHMNPANFHMNDSCLIYCIECNHLSLNDAYVRSLMMERIFSVDKNQYRRDCRRQLVESMMSMTMENSTMDQQDLKMLNHYSLIKANHVSFSSSSSQSSSLSSYCRQRMNEKMNQRKNLVNENTPFSLASSSLSSTIFGRSFD